MLDILNYAFGKFLDVTNVIVLTVPLVEISLSSVFEFSFTQSILMNRETVYVFLFPES